MADNARGFCMGGLGILHRTDESNLFPGQGLRRRPQLRVAIEADALNPFSCLASIRTDQLVAGHARLILRRKRGEFFLLLMARTALLPAGLGRIEGDRFLDGRLIMGVVAGQAHLVLSRVLDLLGTVFSFVKIGDHLFVTHQAVVRPKKILGPLSYFLRIGVKGLRLEVLVAITAGYLAVDRGMEFFGVDPPGGMGWDRVPT
jgi:hypothetical protein